MNGANVENAGKYAVAGGNLEIIHLCEQNHSSFKDGYKTAIEFHRNDVFHYLYENKIESYVEISYLGKLSILYNNYELLSFFETNGLKINYSLIGASIEAGNLFITQYFYEKQQPLIDFSKIETISWNKELFITFLKINVFIILKKILFVNLFQILFI